VCDNVSAVINKLTILGFFLIAECATTNITIASGFSLNYATTTTTKTILCKEKCFS